MRIILCVLIAQLVLTAFAARVQASACNQSPVLSWPAEARAKSFSAPLNIHAFVSIRYYENASGRVVEAAVYEEGKERTLIYHSGRNFIAVISKSPQLDAYTVEQNTPGYLPHLAQIRNLVGYAGAPYTLFESAGAASYYPESTQLVHYFDSLLQNVDYVMPNCILYADAQALQADNTCSITAGPQPQLGPWTARARSVWVRSGFNLALIKRADLDTREGFEIYRSHPYGSSPAGTAVNGGHFFVLKEKASLEAASLVCQPDQPQR